MLEYPKLKTNHREFVALTSLTPQEFNSLLPAFRRVYDRHYPPHKTLAGRRRNGKAGGGRTSPLCPLEQKLLVVLVSHKTYPLPVVWGAVFASSQSRGTRGGQHLRPLLHQAVPEWGVLPERAPRHFARPERQQGEPLDLSIDGPQRRRQRPKKPEQQPWPYRGTKKTPSDKTGVSVTRRSHRVGYLRRPSPGKEPDKKLADKERRAYPRAAPLDKDTGFQGYEPRGQQTPQPPKSRAKELCPQPRNATIASCHGCG